MIPRDKLLHALIGDAMFWHTLPLGTFWAVCAVFIVAAGVEVYQGVTGRGTPDPFDTIAVLIGGLAALVASSFLV